MFNQSYQNPLNFDNLRPYSQKRCRNTTQDGMDPTGFEPAASALQGRRSPPELRALNYVNIKLCFFMIFDKIKKEVIQP
jgi:hypothetical protein